jgi:acyl-CoA synthetase (AMP-forming)/AMP-acid ligase II/acyl carrier protein
MLAPPRSTAREATLFDILTARAAEQPDDDAFAFLFGAEHRTALSYAALLSRALAVGEALKSHGAAGDRVLLVYPTGPEFIAALFGCWAAGRAAVPVYPPRVANDPAMQRFVGIMDDAQPGQILTVSRLVDTVRAVVDGGRIRCLATDHLQEPCAHSCGGEAVEGGPVALLQYTSGTTAFPKGVVITHANLLHNAAVVHRAFGHSPESYGVIWLPPYHDMGLIGGVLQPIYAGFPVTLMSPAYFLQRPLRWLEAISGRRAVTSGGPNFAYELCLRAIPEKDRGRLDLSGWDVAFNGGEPIDPATMDRFAEAFAASGFRRQAFYPCYGLAEATLMVSGGEKGRAPRVAGAHGISPSVVPSATSAVGSMAVSCGCARDGARIVVVDPASHSPCADGAVGEIWVASPSVAAGYWNRPNETEQVFGAHLNGARSGEADAGPFLRTGDLGFIREGELHVTGRLKDLIVIRGVNHYSTDIERTVGTAHAAVRPGCSAAFSIVDVGQERVVIVQEIERRWRGRDCNPIAGAIRQAIAAAHGIDVYAIVLVPPGRVLRTSSGKVRRQELKAAFLAGALNATYEWRQAGQVDAAAAVTPQSSESRADLQSWIAGRLAAAVGIDSSSVDVDEPVARYGLDSLMAVQIAEELSQRLGREVSAALFWDHPTIAELAGALASSGVGTAPTESMTSFDAVS